jgi:hypothetical protein
MYVGLYLPGIRDEIKLTYSADLSKRLSTDTIRDEFVNLKQ